MKMVTLETGKPWTIQELVHECGTYHTSIHMVGTPRVECPGCHEWIDLGFWTKQEGPLEDICLN